MSKLQALLPWLVRRKGADVAARVATSDVIEGRARPLAAHERELYPWLAGSLEYSERYGTLIDDKRQAYLIALIAMAVAAVAVVSAITFAGGTRIVPWVVQVDKTNWAVAVGPAERASAVDDRVLKSMTARWVRALRTVVGSADAQTAFVQDVYSMLTAGSAATRKTNDWFIKNNPMVNIGSRRTEVEITRIYQKGDPMHMMVDWVERSSGTEGTSQRVFEAFLSLEISPPRLEAAILANPLGIYVADYTLSEKTPGQP